MSVIWWTIYILGALTILILWINLIGLLGRFIKAVRDKEWTKVKVIQGATGPQGPRGPKGESCSLSRKDIEALIRMEVTAHLSKFEISRTAFPGLGIDEVNLVPKNDLGDWPTNQPKVDVDKLIDDYKNEKEDK